MRGSPVLRPDQGLSLFVWMSGRAFERDHPLSAEVAQGGVPSARGVDEVGDVGRGQNLHAVPPSVERPVRAPREHRPASFTAADWESSMA